MIKKGVYAAGLSVLNKDLSVNIDATINHAEGLIQNGLHGVFFWGSTGQSQLVSLQDKKKLISKISNHKLKKQNCSDIGERFLFPTGKLSIFQTYLNNSATYN